MASLDPKSGILGKRLAAHLLRRTTFMVNKARIESFATMTADAAVEALFADNPLINPEGPRDRTTGLAWYSVHDAEAKPNDFSEEKNGVKTRLVQSWLFQEMLGDTTIKHKLAIFLHSTFIIGLTTSRNWQLYNYMRLLQYYAYGNIKTFAYKVTLDPMMAQYLDNHNNRNTAPNENYAREFLELFTILKGEQIGVGNYTNYTEDDIITAAKLLTGFRIQNYAFKDADTGLVTSKPVISRHDVSDKQFSAAFGNQVITGATGADNTEKEADMLRELQDFVNMIFAQAETAKAYARKLYRYFVGDMIDAAKETNIITPLANALINQNFELVPVVKMLLKSQHFYDEDDSNSTDNIVGGKVKSALELTLHSLNFFELSGLIRDFETDPANNYKDGDGVRRKINDQGFPFFLPASVEGYDGFYKSGYSCNWFTSTTFIHRYSFYDQMLRGKYATTTNLKLVLASFFDTHFTLPNTFGPADFPQAEAMIDTVVTEVLEVTLPEMPIGDRYTYFREGILNGLSAINFLFEWVAYKDTGDDSDVSESLGNFLKILMNSEEFQTF